MSSTLEGHKITSEDVTAQLAQNLPAVRLQKSIGGLEMVFGPREGEITIQRSIYGAPLATMWPDAGAWFVVVDGKTIAGPISRKHGLVMMMNALAEVAS